MLKMQCTSESKKIKQIVIAGYGRSHHLTGHSCDALCDGRTSSVKTRTLRFNGLSNTPDFNPET